MTGHTEEALLQLEDGHFQKHPEAFSCLYVMALIRPWKRFHVESSLPDTLKLTLPLGSSPSLRSTEMATTIII